MNCDGAKGNRYRHIRIIDNESSKLIMKAAKAKKIITESIWNEMYKEGCVIAITYYA